MDGTNIALVVQYTASMLNHQVVQLLIKKVNTKILFPRLQCIGYLLRIYIIKSRRSLTLVHEHIFKSASKKPDGVLLMASNMRKYYSSPIKFLDPLRERYM
jgi:hypothetical protein